MGVICKYKFDSSIYADLIPTFNSGYSGYTITDEVEGDIITRTIESDKLPTLMRFGSNLDTYVEGSELALLEVLDMNTSGLTSCFRMFKYCKNLTSITCEWDTSNVTNTEDMFACCNKLTSLDVSNFNTSNVTNMRQTFVECNKLTSLDVSNWNTGNVTDMFHAFGSCQSLTSLDVSNWNTGNVTNMSWMFAYCNKLTSLDVSNWNTSKVNNMRGFIGDCYNLQSITGLSNFDTSNVANMSNMFYNCKKLTSLDISNFDTSKVTDTTNMFTNTNSLEVITMFNSDINTINTIGNLTSATLYVDESLDQSQYTGTAPLKVYKEEKLEIKLNSPLLKEDTIEVVDGKICHVHRYEKVVLDGSESWVQSDTGGTINTQFYAKVSDNMILTSTTRNGYCDTKKVIPQVLRPYEAGKNTVWVCGRYIAFVYSLDTISLESFKQWLSENPTTVIYKLNNPTYEDITPLQSSLVLKTFLESSMTIDTILPIETKLSYRTNVPSISTLSTRTTELAESDNVIHNLMNIIDDEVDE